LDKIPNQKELEWNRRENIGGDEPIQGIKHVYMEMLQ
jgi:hypothetical protein